MADLKDCPFCGEPAEMDTHQSYRNIVTGRVETGVAIYCMGCGVQAMLCRGDIPDLEPEMVEDIWNRRVQPPSPEAADDHNPATGEELKARQRGAFFGERYSDSSGWAWSVELDHADGQVSVEKSYSLNDPASLRAMASALLQVADIIEAPASTLRGGGEGT